MREQKWMLCDTAEDDG